MYLYTYHLSSNKPLFTTNRDCHRKAQLDKMQRSTNHGDPGSNGYINIIAAGIYSSVDIMEERAERM